MMLYEYEHQMVFGSGTIMPAHHDLTIMLRNLESATVVEKM